MRKVFLGFFLSVLSISFAKTCPDEKTVEKKVRELTRRDFKVVEISKLKDLNLCQIVLKSGLRAVVIYTDKNFDYLITGNVFSLKEGKNLNEEAVKKHSRVSKKVLKDLEKLTDLKYNPGQKKYVYFISDPDCPFCRRTEPIIKKWAKEKGVEIRHIFFPLPIHPKAKDKAIDIICSGKGYEYVHKDFEPKHICEKGKEKVERNIRYLSKLGVSGTPTIIGQNGKVLIGMPRSEKDLDELIE